MTKHTTASFGSDLPACIATACALGDELAIYSRTTDRRIGTFIVERETATLLIGRRVTNDSRRVPVRFYKGRDGSNVVCNQYGAGLLPDYIRRPTVDAAPAPEPIAPVPPPVSPDRKLQRAIRRLAARQPGGSRIRVFRRVANVDDIGRAALCSTKPDGHRRFFTTLSRTIRTFAPFPTFEQARELAAVPATTEPPLRAMRRSFVAGLSDADLAASIRANRSTLQDISFRNDGTGWASACIYLALYRAELHRRATKPLPPSGPIGNAVEDRDRARDALAQAGAPSRSRPIRRSLR